MASTREATGAMSEQAFPSSRKVYIAGSRPDVRVPMREIELSPTRSRHGEKSNAPIRVYDTSGPRTDPKQAVDIRAGLPVLRQSWILERKDVEEYEGRSVIPNDDGLKASDPRANVQVFPGPARRPLRVRHRARLRGSAVARRDCSW